MLGKSSMADEGVSTSGLKWSIIGCMLVAAGGAGWWVPGWGAPALSHHPGSPHGFLPCSALRQRKYPWLFWSLKHLSFLKKSGNWKRKFRPLEQKSLSISTLENVFEVLNFLQQHPEMLSKKPFLWGKSVWIDSSEQPRNCCDVNKQALLIRICNESWAKSHCKIQKHLCFDKHLYKWHIPPPSGSVLPCSLCFAFIIRESHLLII